MKIGQRRAGGFVVRLRAERARRRVRRCGVDIDIRYARLDALLAEFKLLLLEMFDGFDAGPRVCGCTFGVQPLLGVTLARQLAAVCVFFEQHPLFFDLVGLQLACDLLPDPQFDQTILAAHQRLEAFGFGVGRARARSGETRRIFQRIDLGVGAERMRQGADRIANGRRFVHRGADRDYRRGGVWNRAHLRGQSCPR